MSNLRLFLLLGLAMVGLQLWTAWQHDYAPPPETVSESTATPAADGATPAVDAPAADNEVPTAPSASAEAPAATAPPAETAPAANDRRIIIANDKLRLTVSTRGAEIRQAELKTFPISLEQKDVPVKLLNEDPERYFVSQTGLVSTDQPAPDHTATYAVDGDSFELAEGSDALEVPLTWTDPSGIAVRKADKDLKEKFNAAILALRANGKYKAINDKYFDFDIYGK